MLSYLTPLQIRADHRSVVRLVLARTLLGWNNFLLFDLSEEATDFSKSAPRMQPSGLHSRLLDVRLAVTALR